MGSRAPIYVKTVESGGSIRIKGADGIYNVSTSGPAAIQGGRTILEGGDSGIGTTETPLTVALREGAELTARAGKDINIYEVLGSLNLAEIYGESNVTLRAKDSILDARGERPFAVMGRSVNLIADQGSVGTASSPLHLAAVSGGQLEVQALNGGVYLTIPTAGLVNLGSVYSGGTLAVEAVAQLCIGGMVTSAGALKLSSAGGLTVDTAAKLAAEGKLVLTGLHVTMAEGSSGEAGDELEINAEQAAELSHLKGSRVTINSGGAVTQVEDTGITADTLSVSSRGQQDLSGYNRVSRLAAANTGSGDITINNAGDLAVEAVVQADGGNIKLVNGGDVEIVGDITTTGQVVVEAAGNIIESATGRITAAVLRTSSIGGQMLLGDNRIQSFAAHNQGGDVILRNVSAGLEIASILQTGGGDIVVQNSGGGIVVTGVVQTGDRVSLVADGPVWQTAEGRIADAAGLTVESVGGQELLGANTVQRFRAVNAGGGRVVLRNTAGQLEVTGISQTDGGEIEVVNAGDVEIAGEIATAGQVQIDVTGRITETAEGRVTAAGLRTSSVGGQALLGDNRIDSFAARNEGGDVQLSNSSAELEIAGVVQAAGGDIAVVNREGGIAVTGLVQTQDNINLSAEGSVRQKGDGRFADAAALTVESVGGQELSGDNAVQRFLAINAGGGRVLLRNSSSLEVTEITQVDGGDVEIANSGDVEIAGVVSTTGQVTVEADGKIVETAAGRIDAAALSASSTGGQMLLGDNHIHSFAAYNDGGDIQLNNTSDELNVGSIVQASGGSIEVANSGGGITFTGLVQTDESVSLTAQGVIGQVGDRRFADVVSLTIESTGGLDLSGDNTVRRFQAVNAGGGRVALNNTAPEGLEIIQVLQTDGGEIELTSAGGVTIADEIKSAGGDISIAAGGSIRSAHGDVAIQGKDINLAADQGGIGTRDTRVVVAASGRTNLLADQDIYAEERHSDLDSDFVISRHGSVDLMVPDGRVRIDELRAAKLISISTVSDLQLRNVEVAQLGLWVSGVGGKLGIAEARISEGLAVGADQVELLSLVHTGAEPLRLSIGGGSKAAANSLTLRGRSHVGMLFDSLQADNAWIDADTENLAITMAFVGSRAVIRNRYHAVVADNINKQLFPADIQLYPENKPFYLIMGSDRRILSDAWVVNYDDDYIVNRFATENSFVRITGKMPQVVGFGSYQVSGPASLTLGGSAGSGSGVVMVSPSLMTPLSKMQRRTLIMTRKVCCNENTNNC